MKRFQCPVCGLRVFFEDRDCLRCGHELVYDPAHDAFAVAAPPCPDRTAGLGCNWAAAADGGPCPVCRCVDVAESVGGDTAAPYHAAIRRALRQLGNSGIHPERLEPPLQFRLRDGTVEQVTIGHADGVITLDAAESDPAHREATRAKLDERYRTVLGHVRHELGHWHWQAVVAGDAVLMERFTYLFGDHTADYATALQQHYSANSAEQQWQDRYLSHYASSHPWEDYAETFAHALHMYDTLETCRSVGFIPITGRTPDQVLAVWDEVSVSMNELNRAMGTPDPYPFAPPPPAQTKLGMLLDILGPR